MMMPFTQEVVAGTMGSLLPPACWQQVVVIGLFAISCIAGVAHMRIIVRVRRLKQKGSAERRLRFGDGFWHVGMLRRSWYPPEAERFYRPAILTHVVSGVAMVLLWLHMAAWVR